MQAYLIVCSLNNNTCNYSLMFVIFVICKINRHYWFTCSICDDIIVISCLLSDCFIYLLISLWFCKLFSSITCDIVFCFTVWVFNIACHIYMKTAWWYSAFHIVGLMTGRAEHPAHKKTSNCWNPGAVLFVQGGSKSKLFYYVNNLSFCQPNFIIFRRCTL